MVRGANLLAAGSGGGRQVWSPIHLLASHDPGQELGQSTAWSERQGQPFLGEVLVLSLRYLIEDKKVICDFK